MANLIESLGGNVNDWLTQWGHHRGLHLVLAYLCQSVSILLFVSLCLPIPFWIFIRSAVHFVTLFEKFHWLLAVIRPKSRVPYLGILVMLFCLSSGSVRAYRVRRFPLRAALLLKLAYSIPNPFFSSVRAAVSHIVFLPSFLFFCVVGLSSPSPGKSAICDVNDTDTTLYPCRKIGRHDRPGGNRMVAIVGDDGYDSGCSVSECSETGNISVTYGLEDEKIRMYTGRGHSSDVLDDSRYTVSVPEPPRMVEAEPMALGRTGETEPLGSPVAGQYDRGEGDQRYIKGEDGNAGEEGKEGAKDRCRTPFNVANSSMTHSTSYGYSSISDLQPVGSQPQDDKSEGASVSFLQFSLRVVLDY